MEDQDTVLLSEGGLPENVLFFYLGDTWGEGGEMGNPIIKNFPLKLCLLRFRKLIRRPELWWSREKDSDMMSLCCSV